VVKSAIFYMYTGFLVDLSINNPEDISITGLDSVRVSFDILDLYKVAVFLVSYPSSSSSSSTIISDSPDIV
jgi:hypothetical protein